MKGPETYLFLLFALSFVSIVYIRTTEAFRFPHQTADDENPVEVKIQSSNTRQRRDINIFPDELDVELSTDQLHKKVHKLRKNSEMPANKPLYLMRDGVVKKFRFYSHEMVAYYSEKDSGATFMIWPKSGENRTTGEFDLFGTFISDNEQYLVQLPKDNDSEHAYTISKFTDKRSGVIDYSMAPDPDALKLQEGLTSEQVMSRATTNREKRQTNAYEVEIFFVMDYAMYEIWYGYTEGQTNRNAATIEHLYQLAAFILSGLNLRYDFVTVNGSTITCRYAGIYIADSSAASSAYSGNVANTVLGDFKIWAEHNLDGNYDHLMLYTGIDIGSVTEGTLKLSTAGLAYLPNYNDNGGLVTPGVCGDYRYSINEGRFKPIITSVGAHELGHNLGAYHDNSSECGENDGYVMAPSYSVSNDTTKNLRLWKFSNCSLADFDVYINALQVYYDNNGQTNCLLSQTATDATVLDPYMDEISDLPGQIYDPDAQCEKIQGTGSYLYRSEFDSNYSSICALMPCASSSEAGWYFLNVPWEGTSCGNGKICQAGQCVTSDLAPNVDDEACLFGDLPYNVPWMELSQNCREFLGSDATSYRCYTNSYRQGCCATCEEIKQNNTAYTDCEYGDRFRNCDNLTTSNLYSCATESFRSDCCKSCEDKKLDIAGCEYGDRYINCDNLTDTNLYSCATESFRSDCCITCEEKKLNIPGCEYGDRYINCDNLTDTNLYSCATESFRSDCCITCEEKKLNIPDCPYGDMYTNCADFISSCSTSESTATDCCQTCAPATTTTTTTTTTTPTTTTTTTPTNTTTTLTTTTTTPTTTTTTFPTSTTATHTTTSTTTTTTPTTTSTTTTTTPTTTTTTPTTTSTTTTTTPTTTTTTPTTTSTTTTTTPTTTTTTPTTTTNTTLTTTAPSPTTTTTSLTTTTTSHSHASTYVLSIISALPITVVIFFNTV